MKIYHVMSPNFEMGSSDELVASFIEKQHADNFNEAFGGSYEVVEADLSKPEYIFENGTNSYRIDLYVNGIVFVTQNTYHGDIFNDDAFFPEEKEEATKTLVSGLKRTRRMMGDMPPMGEYIVNDIQKELLVDHWVFYRLCRPEFLQEEIIRKCAMLWSQGINVTTPLNFDFKVIPRYTRPDGSNIEYPNVFTSLFGENTEIKATGMGDGFINISEREDED